MYEDKMLVCIDDGQEFTFTAGEQKFYASKGFGEPKRCEPCRAKKKAEKKNLEQKGDRGTY